MVGYGFRKVFHTATLDTRKRKEIYGVSKRVTLKPRADYRIIVSEIAVAR